MTETKEFTQRCFKCGSYYIYFNKEKNQIFCDDCGSTDTVESISDVEFFEEVSAE